MMAQTITQLKENAVALLQQLIAIPSFSREESATADLLHAFLSGQAIHANRHKHNVWAVNSAFDSSKPTLLLNSHHDTVKPNAHYTWDPFTPEIVEGKLYGLGSNDAGGCLVALLATFLYFYDKPNLPYNLVFAASAEEEISGKDGITSLLPLLGKIDMAIVGEPTGLHMAVAEKGLIVLDCIAHGVAGHAARDEGSNAIYQAFRDIGWFQTHKFSRKSDLLGAVKMNVTMIQAGTQHNVIPADCTFTVDVRVNECYTNEEIVTEINQHTLCQVSPRSLRLSSSHIAEDHPLVVAGKSIGLRAFGSSTLSDKALMNCPSLKIGPGLSARSHTADEYVLIEEIEQGIDIYISVLHKLSL